MTEPPGEERWAAAAVCAATGFTSEPYDRAGRQGAVDFLLHLPDGHVGALEVTSHAERGSREVGALLARDRFQWPNPGKWAWSIAFDPSANVTRVREIYADVIESCELNGVASPDQLPDNVLMRSDVLFDAAYEEFGVRFHGHLGEPDQRRSVSVLPGAIGGGVDEGLVQLPQVVTSLLGVSHIASRIAKLTRHRADEHHLFIAIGPGGVPFAQYYPLCGVPASLPTPDPQAPDDLTHLWLATGYGPTMVSWSRGHGWGMHRIFSAGPAPTL